MTVQLRQQALALTLIAVAGFVDAVSYLQFARIFVSFMSGNSTTFGIKIAQGDLAHLAAPAGAFAGFVAGTFVGTVIGQKAGYRHAPATLAVVAAALLAAMVLPAPSTGFAPAITALAIAMGAQNATLGKVGDSSVSLTYVTGMVARIGKGLAQLATGQPQPVRWGFFMLMWIGLIAGATLGAALQGAWGLTALILPVIVLAMLALVTAATDWRVAA
ncbi:hypothetical protein OCGS_2185 [Oceaniovalibus guishaninsula JLT2003]|uniref:DUF1275 domain-containing protein n=1 Tax=Oceaniovalibus guishaninsula JLT2003 TaxID=1231392 RepID=K2GM91_9RHOB|nr:YoaK family protein [Oceaniovalibus guishaninsula]EKE43851.1 hypothetical protein OCGS_2185 [Oceaniovalibus guishaninsula JLT2003]